jgi:hypothetical protein
VERIGLNVEDASVVFGSDTAIKIIVAWISVIAYSLFAKD